MIKPSLVASETPVRRSADHVSVEVDGELMLMSTSQGRYVGLDDIGSEIWRRLEHAQTAATLCASLADDFEAEPGVIDRDVSQFLAGLHKSGLLDLK
jgi:hypothetical protein